MVLEEPSTEATQKLPKERMFRKKSSVHFVKEVYSMRPPLDVGAFSSTTFPSWSARKLHRGSSSRTPSRMG
ncbi:MAG: hypothetical protein LBJ16_03725 [Holosporaceae bacterium]|nr:hypothetical protein [Holosporaceae bacterium]